MIAFVMSGGGNRGALEAGALLALFEAGIKPAILVGTSAGSLNATYLATDPTLAGAQRLAEIWAHARKEDFFPGGTLSMLWRLVRGKSLFSSDALRRYAEANLPPDKRRFGDIAGVKLYVTAANLNTATLYLYGDQPDALLIDAVMASASHPLAYPPALTGRWQLVDGGVIANVPVGIAVDRGATEVYILDVGYSGRAVAEQTNVLGVVNRSITVMMYRHFLMDLKYVLENSDVLLHHILMGGFEETAMWDMTHGAEMVQVGKKAAAEYLKAPSTLASVPEAVFGEDLEVPPAGAQVYIPSYFSPTDLLGLPQGERLIAAYLTRCGASEPLSLARALGRTDAQIRIDAASLIKKGCVQRLEDGKLKISFGHTRRGKMPDRVWDALSQE